MQGVQDALTEDGRAERIRGGGLHGRHDVLVDVHRQRHVGVPETLADHLGVHVVLQQDGGVGVAQVVEPDTGNVELLHCADERVGDAVRVGRRAVRLREHVILPAPHAGGHLLFELLAPVVPQLGDGGLIKRDGVAAARGLEIGDP